MRVAPAVITNRQIARLFKAGYSVQGLVRKLKLPYPYIENAIRKVMNRRGK